MEFTHHLAEIFEAQTSYFEECHALMSTSKALCKQLKTAGQARRIELEAARAILAGFRDSLGQALSSAQLREAEIHRQEKEAKKVEVQRHRWGSRGHSLLARRAGRDGCSWWPGWGE